MVFFGISGPLRKQSLLSLSLVLVLVLILALLLILVLAVCLSLPLSLSLSLSLSRSRFLRSLSVSIRLYLFSLSLSIFISFSFSRRPFVVGDQWSLPSFSPFLFADKCSVPFLHFTMHAMITSVFQPSLSKSVVDLIYAASAFCFC